MFDQAIVASGILPFLGFHTKDQFMLPRSTRDLTTLLIPPSPQFFIYLSFYKNRVFSGKTTDLWLGYKILTSLPLRRFTLYIGFETHATGTLRYIIQGVAEYEEPVVLVGQARS